MRGRTRAGLLARLERLECRVAVGQHHFKLRFGSLRRLPPEYTGERHVVISRHLPNQGDREWVEFEEVPGPEPIGPHEVKEPIGPQEVNGYMDIVFVSAYGTGASNGAK
jgi:hypothetical protein